MKICQRHHDCRINEYTYRGHRLVVLENQYLKLGVLASKGADIVEFRYKPADVDVLWHSPQGILPPVHHIPTKARNNGNFLDYYEGGWQEILPNPGDSVSYLNAELGQHGETALLPWEVSVVEDSLDVISVEFSIRTVRMPFALMRRIELGRENRHVRISEELRNEGEERISFGWGHHPCFGEPFLEPGCEIDLPTAKANTLNEGSYSRYGTGQSTTERILRSPTGERVRVDQVPAKSSRTEDVVYFDELSAGWYALRNPRLELGFALQWDVSLFPYLWSWQVYGGAFGYPYYGAAYTLGLEPFSCPPSNLLECIEKEVCTSLEAGERVTTNLFAGFINGKRRVKAMVGDWEFELS